MTASSEIVSSVISVQAKGSLKMVLPRNNERAPFLDDRQYKKFGLTRSLQATIVWMCNSLMFPSGVRLLSSLTTN